MCVFAVDGEGDEHRPLRVIYSHGVIRLATLLVCVCVFLTLLYIHEYSAFLALALSLSQPFADFNQTN